MRLKTSLLAAALLCTSVHADVSKNAPTLELRYRFESVDDAAFAKNAAAHTLRARFGWLFANTSGFSAYADAERVQRLTGNYNDTINGRTNYPTIADPQGTELNQAWLSYAQKSYDIKLGRQRLILDNARFFGNVAWRQNEQTFDAINLGHKPAEGWQARYAYLTKVNRVFGQYNPNDLLAQQDLDAHLFNLSRLYATGAVTAYGYFVKNQDVPLSSARTLGLRATNKWVMDTYTFGIAGELARQDNYRGGASAIGANYFLLEPFVVLSDQTIKLGYEQLGSNGRASFNTPFATLHVFNGWADRFLTTPRDGLQDTYLGIQGLMAWDLTYAFFAHDYSAARGSTDLGREFDFSLSKPINKQTNVLLKYADYQAGDVGADTKKFWLQLEWKL
jgi:Alginate export